MFPILVTVLPFNDPGIVTALPNAVYFVIVALLFSVVYSQSLVCSATAIWEKQARNSVMKMRFRTLLFMHSFLYLELAFLPLSKMNSFLGFMRFSFLWTSRSCICASSSRASSAW